MQQLISHLYSAAVLYLLLSQFVSAATIPSSLRHFGHVRRALYPAPSSESADFYGYASDYDAPYKGGSISADDRSWYDRPEGDSVDNDEQTDPSEALPPYDDTTPYDGTPPYDDSPLYDDTNADADFVDSYHDSAPFQPGDSIPPPITTSTTAAPRDAARFGTFDSVLGMSNPSAGPIAMAAALLDSLTGRATATYDPTLKGRLSTQSRRGRNAPTSFLTEGASDLREKQYGPLLSVQSLMNPLLSLLPNITRGIISSGGLRGAQRAPETATPALRLPRLFNYRRPLGDLGATHISSTAASKEPGRVVSGEYGAGRQISSSRKPLLTRLSGSLFGADSSRYSPLSSTESSKSASPTYALSLPPSRLDDYQQHNRRSFFPAYPPSRTSRSQSYPFSSRAQTFPTYDDDVGGYDSKALSDYSRSYTYPESHDPYKYEESDGTSTRQKTSASSAAGSGSRGGGSSYFSYVEYI